MKSKHKENTTNTEKVITNYTNFIHYLSTPTYILLVFAVDAKGYYDIFFSRSTASSAFFVKKSLTR